MKRHISSAVRPLRPYIFEWSRYHRNRGFHSLLDEKRSMLRVAKALQKYDIWI